MEENQGARARLKSDLVFMHFTLNIKTKLCVNLLVPLADVDSLTNPFNFQF